MDFGAFEQMVVYGTRTCAGHFENEKAAKSSGVLVVLDYNHSSNG
jgi:hypothetical protein